MTGPRQVHVAHAKVVEERIEELLLGLLEVAFGLALQDAEDVDDVLGGAEVTLDAPAHRIGDLPEMQQGLRAEAEHERREAHWLLRTRVQRLGRPSGEGRYVGCGRDLGLCGLFVPAHILPRPTLAREAPAIGPPDPAGRALFSAHGRCIPRRRPPVSHCRVAATRLASGASHETTAAAGQAADAVRSGAPAGSRAATRSTER